MSKTHSNVWMAKVSARIKCKQKYRWEESLRQREKQLYTAQLSENVIRMWTNASQTKLFIVLALTSMLCSYVCKIWIKILSRYVALWNWEIILNAKTADFHSKNSLKCKQIIKNSCWKNRIKKTFAMFLCNEDFTVVRPWTWMRLLWDSIYSLRSKKNRTILRMIFRSFITDLLVVEVGVYCERLRDFFYILLLSNSRIF